MEIEWKYTQTVILVVIAIQNKDLWCTELSLPSSVSSDMVHSSSFMIVTAYQSFEFVTNFVLGKGNKPYPGIYCQSKV